MTYTRCIKPRMWFMLDLHFFFPLLFAECFDITVVLRAPTLWQACMCGYCRIIKSPANKHKYPAIQPTGPERGSWPLPCCILHDNRVSWGHIQHTWYNSLPLQAVYVHVLQSMHSNEHGLLMLNEGMRFFFFFKILALLLFLTQPSLTLTPSITYPERRPWQRGYIKSSEKCVALW